MRIFLLIQRYLRARLLVSSLTAGTVALGVALLAATATIASSMRAGFMQIAGGFEMLVGAKGSPTQLVLNALFLLDTPTGNIPLDLFLQLQGDSRVASLIPLNFADNYRAFPIVGTTGEYFQLIARRLGKAQLSTTPSGRFFEKDFEVVIGATVQQETGLQVGETFLGAHGVTGAGIPGEDDGHQAFPYTVVGVLERTHSPVDRGIFTTLGSVWRIHGQRPPGEKGGPREVPAYQVTALLVKAKGFMEMMQLYAQINGSPHAQVVFPSQVVAKLFEVFGTGETILKAIVFLTLVIATIAIMISMWAATVERRREIATMRALGATKGFILKLFLMESAAIALLGAVVGLVAGRGIALLMGRILERSAGILLGFPPFQMIDLVPLGAVVLLGILAGAVPAFAAYRTDVAENLYPVS